MFGGNKSKMIELLPLKQDVETKSVLKLAAKAHKALAELKGSITSIPNENILLETLALREARESSAIENIISTFAEVYQSNLFTQQFASPAAKEVYQYAEALKMGFALVRQNNLLTSNYILQIQAIIEQNKAGFRKLPGTKLLNDITGEVVYIPPQDYETIVQLMQNLETFINDDHLTDLDPLVKMAIIHHQFESIHPFYDGNGRTGRIINILYLVKQQLLDLPVLYLSRYIIKYKSDYYRLLQKVRDTNDWEEWIMFILQAIETSATDSVLLIASIKTQMLQYKQLIRSRHTKMYSQDLLNNLFKYPYTKIEYIERYLEALVKENLLVKQKVGRDNFYVNQPLFNLLSGK